MRRKHKKHIIKTWILSIAALAVGIVFVSPLYLVFVNSVKTVREIYLSPLGLPVEISWNNFGRVMEKINFGQALCFPNKNGERTSNLLYTPYTLYGSFQLHS